MTLAQLSSIATTVALSLVSSSVAQIAAPAVEARPNILWIVCEDMSPNLGCYGDAYANSPNLDKLSSQGVRFTRAYATTPVCSPSRTSLLFGRYATTLGANNHRSSPHLDPSLRGYAAYLREAGYFTANHSKTDYNSSGEKATIRDCWSSDGTWRDRPDAKQPFMSVINLEATHQSNTSVIPYAKFVEKVQSKLSVEQIHDPAKAPLMPFLPDTPGIRKGVARYYDCITAMDQQVGEILADLEKDGLADSTIVFFYSDHGAGQPRCKTTALNTGLNTPLIVRVPQGLKQFAISSPGSEVGRLTSFTDLGPTVLSLAGLKQPPTMTGRPFMGQFAAEPSRYVFGSRDRLDETFDAQRTVTDGRYRYVRHFMPHLPMFQFHGYFGKGPIYAELYDLRKSGKLSGLAQQTFGLSPRPVEALYDSESDPFETNNLIASPELRSKADELRTALRTWMLEGPDLNLVPEAELEARAGSKPVASLAGELPMDRIVDTAWRVDVSDIDELIRRSSDTDAAVRFWAVMGLRQHLNDPRVEPALQACLKDESPSVCAESAAAILAKGDSADARAVLKRLSESSDPIVARHANRLERGPN